MPNLDLFTLFVLILPLALSQSLIFPYDITPQNATYYIDETNKTEDPDGSRDHPFNSLDEASFRLYVGIYDIVLLGQSITITSQVIFPQGSICTIRPQTIPRSGYYPLKFGVGASMSILETNVTFQDIQFIELDPLRDPMMNAISYSSGLLFLNRVLVSDIQYQDTLYTFISTGLGGGGEGTVLSLHDCQFKNLRNVRIHSDPTGVRVQNTTFENIEMNNGAFFVFESYLGWENVLRMSNTSLMNAKFNYTEDQETVGFVMLIGSNVNVSLEGFSAKNVSISYGTAFIGMRGREGEEGDQELSPRRVNVQNVGLEDIVEIGETREGRGLIFDISGSEKFTVNNLTARNLLFKSGSLLRYSPYDWGFGSQILLQNIKIYNSSNTNFLIYQSDGGRIENVELVNVTSKGFPVFFFLGSGTVSIKNISGRNISGSVISLEQVYSQNLKNITLYNVSMSQGPQNLILLTRYSNISKLGIIRRDHQSIVVSNLFIDGYEYIGAEDQEKKAYLMKIEAETGTILIRNSIWKNINTGGLFGPKMNSLKIDNLTVNGMFGKAAEIFRFESFDSVKIINSRVYNNENQGFVVIDVPEDTKGLPMISFENISVVENNVNNSLSFVNLCEFKSPKKAIQVGFLNCLFQDNKIRSVIKITQSQGVNISLEKNTFIRSYAQGPGGIFSSENMQEKRNLLIANNNVFQDNFCQENGGIFYFLDSWYQVSLTNNTYKNNSAKNGGIGFILRSTISFKENNSVYSDNTAELDGGLWFIGSNQFQNLQSPISFNKTVFNNSGAGHNGGAFYLFDGSLSIHNSSFTKSQAGESGGVFFLQAFSSLIINHVDFQETTAPEGSLVFAASLLSASLVIEQVTVNNSKVLEGEGTLVDINSGLVMVKDCVISEISGLLLFDFKGSSVRFDGTRINDIDCSKVKKACVLNGESVDLKWGDTEIMDVVLQGDLVVLDEKSMEKGEVTTVNITTVE